MNDMNVTTKGCLWVSLFQCLLYGLLVSVHSFSPSQTLLPRKTEIHPNNPHLTTTVARSRSSLYAAAKSASSKKSSSGRQNRVAALRDWMPKAWSEQDLALRSGNGDGESNSGLGWFVAAPTLESGRVVLTVPATTALTVESPGDGPDDGDAAKWLRDAVNGGDEELPWYAQMSAYLHKLDQISDVKGDVRYRPWLDSLPRQFDTPFHWSRSALEDLQYDSLVQAVERQTSSWKKLYNRGSLSSRLSWEQFVWGCECARSRAFSGSSTGTFSPGIYAFTLLLVTIYVGLGLGTLEQAANGAGVVLSVFVLKDFVVPKFFKKKRYIICPMIDMANHKSIGNAGDVSFEYFGNAYSLTTTAPLTSGDQLYISYGARSNDQLLQYYGFVEADNPHDVYVMPPLREWDIGALETACGRTFSPGRLQKLDRAGLLGNVASSTTSSSSDGGGDDDDVGNVGGGVVLTRAVGLDPAVMQALRALVSTDEEWDAAGEAIGNFAQECGRENEQCARLVARTAIQMEVDAKATTLDEDEKLLKRMDTMKSLDSSVEEGMAVRFRIEKKKLLRETIGTLN